MVPGVHDEAPGTVLVLHDERPHLSVGLESRDGTGLAEGAARLQGDHVLVLLDDFGRNAAAVGHVRIRYVHGEDDVGGEPCRHLQRVLLRMGKCRP